MSKRKKDRGRAAPERVAVPRSSLVLLVTLAWVAVQLGALYLLRACDVKLGQGALYYRYSPLDGLRAVAALSAIGLAFMAWIAVVFASVGRLRFVAFTTAVLLMILSGIWIWLAPPSAVIQHSFNLRSPSQEGAFYIETMKMPPLAQYLREFDRHIQHTPQEMMGTRVLSNPPGMTILAAAVERFWPAQTDPPGILERYLLSIDTPLFALQESVDTLHLSMVLTAMWALSGLVAYGVGRVFLSRSGAMAYAILATFTASAVHFTPGKDAAQLLTINLMVWTWFAAWKRNSRWLAFVSGIFLTIGAASGLIHFWLAASVFAAVAWEAGIARTTWRLALPALGGLLVFVLVVDLAIGWNLFRTWYAVLVRFGEIQQTFAINRTIWFFIGIPLFLLFVGPGQVVFAVLAARHRRMNFGMRLTIVTLATMLATYLTGVTYELPRLWVAFMPPLTLGLMLAAPLARGTQRKAVVALAMVVAIQIFSTAWHWSRLDVRESEYRLKEKRFFN